MDNSFIKLHDTIKDALSPGDLKNTQLVYYTSIQLLPTETYLQITNISGGISFQGDYKVEAITNCNTVLADITENVFIEEFTDDNGETQCVIEYVNIGQDFFGRAIILKFTHTISDVVYYTNPIKITAKNEEKTIRFDFSDYEKKEGFDYENAPFKQSIRIYCEYTTPNNKSEVGTYYQISNGNTISTRKLKSRSHSYICNNIDLHTYNALDSLFNHSEVFIDGEMVTDSPMVEPDERKGQSNLFSASFELYKNEDSTYNADFQIFEGVEISANDFYPSSSYTLSTLQDDITIQFNVNINKHSGYVTIYDSSNSVVHSFTEDDIVVSSNVATISGLLTHITSNDDYYIKISDSLFSYINVYYEGISDESWSFRVVDGMFNNLQFNNSQFLTD